MTFALPMAFAALASNVRPAAGGIVSGHPPRAHARLWAISMAGTSRATLAAPVRMGFTAALFPTRTGCAQATSTRWRSWYARPLASCGAQAKAQHATFSSQMATFKELAVFFLDRRAQSSNWNRANPGLLPPNVEVSTQGLR